MKKIATMLAAFGLISLAACGASQSDECKKYLECVEAVTAGSAATYESTYGEDGTCWENSDTSDACTAECTAATTTLKTANPNQAKCS